MSTNRETSPTFAVIAGGGTSGHIVPALAIAELLVESGQRPESLYFLGSDRGAEVALLANSPYPHSMLRVDGFQRSWHPRSLIRTAAMIPMMLRAVRSARELLVSLRPNVVVSVGGYASIPAARAAHQLAIPVVTCSYDRRPGIATRLQSRYSVASAVAYMPSELNNAKLTGAPVRAVLRHLNRSASRSAARSRLNIAEHRRLVVVMGGSLGSAVLNQTVRGIVELWVRRSDLAILHLSGTRYFTDEMPNVNLLSGSKDGQIDYQRLAYCDNMADVYAAADLIVSRAGASSVAEIATVGVPSILIPWKGAAENHQRDNAQWLVGRGGAVLVDESDLSISTLTGVISDLLDHYEKLTQIGERAYELGLLHRECSIAEVIVDAAYGATRGEIQK
ncbi:MAG: UDP-N-acetylglucosamine--N-acetylmuramyl-(pentapeptide) pyrophosphoryl-undecaprenol N-acetylglucosamine transferase [Actinomycetota bacterium]